MVVRLDHVDVGEVGRQRLRAVGVVGDDDVALFHVGYGANRWPPVRVDQKLNAGGGRIGEDLAVAVNNAGAEVGGLLDEGRTRSTLQRRRHLISDGGRLVGKYLEEDGVELHGTGIAGGRRWRRDECRASVGAAAGGCQTVAPRREGLIPGRRSFWNDRLGRIPRSDAIHDDE